MTRTRLLSTLALAALLVTAGCSSLVGTNQSPNANANNPNAPASAAADGGPERTVEVAAAGQIEAEPNRAVVRVAVTSRADSVETVRQQLAENASSVRQALRDAGLGADQIATEDYDIRRNFRHEREPDRPKYQGRHAFVVTFNDTDRAGEIVVTAVENGATQVRDVRFTVDRETRLALREQALADAMDNARGRAQVAASNANLQLAGVHTVRTAEVSVEPFRRHRAGLGDSAAGGGGAPPTAFESGTVTVTAQVLVIYNATEA